MQILLTNDDGIHAPGIAALLTVAAEFGEVTIVAPTEHKSGCSHAATTDRPLLVEELSAGRFAVTGTPVDCVRVAILHLGLKPDLVLSGINDGGNLGVDLLMSGTVAAAREATLMGLTGIAVSQYRKAGQIANWERSARFAASAIRHVLADVLPERSFWNINLPDVPPNETPSLVRCRPDPLPLPIRYEADGEHLFYRGDYHGRPREEGTDVDVCFIGRIAISLITQDFGPASRQDQPTA